MNDVPYHGRPPKRDKRVEIKFRCTPQQKADLRLLADAGNVSIGQLLDDFAARFAASTQNA
jgi:hypothetical protein